MNSSVSPQEAANVLCVRREARQSLRKYTSAVSIEPEPAEHHELLIEKLQQIEDGVIDRLMVFMPPGSAKSTYANVLFPSHYMGRFSDQKVVTGSYDSSLATRFGRRTRNLTESPEYQQIFQTGLTADSKAKGEWELQNGSAYLAVGVGSGVTGNRADGAIIDDPIKGRKDADSVTVRNSTWDWYQGDLITRLKPEAWLVMILTRWHEDDPAGRILPKDWDGESGPVECRDGRVWEVLCLAASARKGDPIGRKEGEWLWPEWFSPAWWAKTKFEQSSRNWGSLYQQTPKPDAGTYFKRAWFWRYEVKDLPEVHKYMTGDFAVTEPDDDNDPDYTSVGVHGIEAHKGQSRIYLGIDGWHGQLGVLGDEDFSPDEDSHESWLTYYFNLVKEHLPLCEFAEVGVIRRSIEGLMKRQRRERKAWGHMEWMPSIGDKMANARALQGMAEMGLVGIANNEHGDWLLEQLVGFPTAKHDDGVDESAMIARVIDEAHPALTAVPEPKDTDLDAWGRPRHTQNWKTG